MLATRGIILIIVLCPEAIETHTSGFAPSFDEFLSIFFDVDIQKSKVW